MMMQVLAAAGIELLADTKRGPDVDNPLGYFEFEKAADLSRDTSWIAQARGKAVKIVAQLLPLLPTGEFYQIVIMDRDLVEVVASQNAMLARLGRQGANLQPSELLHTYACQIEQVQTLLSQMPNVRILLVDYASLLQDPKTGVDRLARFLEVPFNRVAAETCIRPELQRQKSAASSAPTV
jgi:hypothetical protein